MKKLLIISMLLLLIPLVHASTDDLKLSMETVETQEPGSKFTVNIDVENPTADTLEDITITLVEDDPFIIEDNKQEISSLDSNETKTLSFDIEIEDDAESDTYSLEVKYQEGSDSSDKESYSIKVQSTDSNVALTKISTSPEVIKQGQETTLKITLENNGKTKAKNVRARLDLSNVPFAPINGIEGSVTTLNIGDESELSFKIKALPDAESGTYKIPLSITYTNEAGEPQVKQELLSVTIGSTPVIDITTESEKPIILNEASTFTVLLTNSGLENVKLATLTLESLPDYEIVSTNKIYIGNIDSDDYQSAEFTIIPKTSNPPKITLTFKDSNNKDFKLEATLDTKVYTSEEAKRLGLIPNGTYNTIIVIGIIILLVVIYLIYRRRKKKND